MIIPLVIAYCALTIHGIPLPSVGGVDIEPWHLSYVVIFAYFFVVFAARRFSLLKNNVAELPAAAIAVLTIALIVGGVRSTEVGYAIAVVLAQVANLTLFILLAFGKWQATAIRRTSRAVFIYGVVYSIVSLAVFTVGLMSYPNPLSLGPIGESLGYSYERGPLRLVGLAGDPNFCAQYLLLPFGIGMLSERENATTYLGTATIALAIVATLSRTAIVGGLLAIFAVGIVVYVSQRAWRGRILRRVSIVIGTSSAVIAVVLAQSSYLRQFVASRMSSIASQSRGRLWGRAADQVDSLVLGEGLGSMRQLVGTFVHNTFLDALFELGIFGLVAWGGVLTAGTVVGVKALKEDNVVPWLFWWLGLIVFSVNFSILYNPAVYLAIGGMAAFTTCSHSKTTSQAM